MIGIVVRIVLNAIALWVTALVYKDITFGAKPSVAEVLGVAVIFGLVNAFVKPVVRLLTLPVRMGTLGLVGFVINAALLLLVAWAAGQMGFAFRVGGFPGAFGADTIVSAIIGAAVLSIVSMLVDLLPVGAKR